MKLKQLVLRNRSYRRFFQDRPVSRELLVDLVELARLTPSGRNLQPLRYAVVHDPAACAELFPLLAWAGYLSDWNGPVEGERPSAYIVMCNDDSLTGSSAWDQGIAAQTILLGAVEAGLGGCIIASVRKKEVAELLSLSEHLTPVLVVALGQPKENVVLTEVHNGDIRYYRDANGTHFVPKRSLEDILL